MLQQLLRSSEKQVQKIIVKHLHNYDLHNKPGDRFIYATMKTPAPVLIVAHTDTVHKQPPAEIFHDSKKGVLWSPTGLGADDRAGVYAALLLSETCRCDLLFTTGEENGGVGASAFIDQYPNNPGYSMILQLDRKNANDAVFYSNRSTDFQDYILSFGFQDNFGSFSDISIIAPDWQVNAVNLSVGYVQEHTTQEHLFLHDLQSTVHKVKAMLSQDIPLFAYTEAYSDFNYYGDFDVCSICGQDYHYEDLLFVDNDPEIEDYLCIDCACNDDYTFECLVCRKNHAFDRLAYNDLAIYDGMICVDCINSFPEIRPNVKRKYQYKQLLLPVSGKEN